uniref:Uncharacterized protein n=1 Tax=Buteo japonicus TaxID=224669 RepID=A0A8C0B303_9AVES
VLPMGCTDCSSTGFPWGHSLLWASSCSGLMFHPRKGIFVHLISEFHHIMVSCVTHSMYFSNPHLSAAMTAESWIGLILSIEREHWAYNNNKVLNYPSPGLIFLRLACPLDGDGIWHIFPSLCEIMQGVMKQCLTD